MGRPDKRKDDADPERPGAERRRPSPGRNPAGWTPPAGPHADPALTNPDATPGAGTLPRANKDGDVDPASG